MVTAQPEHFRRLYGITPITLEGKALVIAVFDRNTTGVFAL
jgi:alpha-D-ribose 1-methylphosphonate 5-triphosphate synthase subunit PhnI